MNKHILTLLLVGTLLSIQLNAQIEKVIYQSFEVNDSTYQFSVDLIDPFETIIWNGSSVMVETTIKFKGAPYDMLVIVIKDGRYNAYMDNHFPLSIVKGNKRWVLKNNSTGQDIEEWVTRRIYIPEEFKLKAPNEFSRRDDITADNRIKN